MIYFFLKRVVDITGSMIGVIIFLPAFIIVSLIIKLDSEGPVFVELSDRVGRNGKKFRMYKFRSMIANAHVKIKRDPKFKKLYKKFEKNDFKLSNDPRVTRVGKFLRKTSLDEIPQFFNVLKGNMTLVGPRALYPEELELRKKDYPDLEQEIKDTLKVKPGISGPWQVSGRSEVDFPERVKMDAQYAKRHSILYDLTILLKTIPSVIKGRGAQ